MQYCKEDIRNYQPDVVILVDYPGFNLKIAQYAKSELHLPVHYYISPKIWAWKQYRIKAFRKYVDHIYSILPFEPAFFRNLDYEVDYVGNPSVDSVAEYRTAHPTNRTDFYRMNRLEEKPILALLAGSRRQEIKDNLPTMLRVVEKHPDLQAVIAGAPAIEPEYYQQFLKGSSARIVFNQTYPLLSFSHAALVTSGTATLETGLFRVPQVVCYSVIGGKLANFVFRHFFHTPYISLVNLIGGKEIVQELFGGRFTEEQIDAELNRILHDKAYRERMLEGYDAIIKELGMAGAAQRAARLIVNRIKQ